MKISMAVFTAALSKENIERAVSRMEEEISFSFFPYHTANELLEAYRRYADQFDGFLFSGPLPYQMVVSNVEIPQKPFGYFDVTESDVYRMLLKTICLHPGLDIRRIWVDEVGKSEIPWDELFGVEGMRPQGNWEYLLSREEEYDQIRDMYVKRWQSRKIDFFLIRATTLVPKLQAAGVAYDILLPSEKSIQEVVKTVADAIKSGRKSNQAGESVYGIIRPAEENFGGQREAFEKRLYDVCREAGQNLILRQNKNDYELITSLPVLKILTNSYETCRLSAALRKRQTGEFSLGWGVGNDILQARKNAQRAVKESMKNKDRASYLVTESDELVGPLQEGKSMVISVAPTKEAMALAKEFEISVSNMQKLLNLWKQQKSIRISRNDLALYLNVTMRTVTRILKNLMDAGAAQMVAVEQQNTPGRPMAIYKLDFEKWVGGQ